MGGAADEQARGREEQDCIDRMGALSFELRFAVKAIAANDISALEESVRRQAEQGVRLKAALMGCSAKPFIGSGARLGSAARGLSRAAEEYAAVLEHSGRSLRMLGSLHRQRTSADGEAGVSAGNGRQRWSWEV